MQNLPLIISIMALLISASSFPVAVIAFRRDTARIRAWSTISYDSDDPVQAQLHVHVANIGRRPVLVRNLIRKSGKSTWSTLLNPPLVGDNGVTTDIGPALEAIQRKTVAQMSAVKLSEAEVFELVYRTPEYTTFIGTHERDLCIANELFVDDVTGRRYPVEDAAKNLAKLGKAWRTQSEAQAWNLEVKLGLVRGPLRDEVGART